MTDFQCSTCGIVDISATGVKYVSIEAIGSLFPDGIYMPNMYEELSTVDTTTIPLSITAGYNINLPAWYIQHGGGFSTEPTNCIVINGGTNVDSVHIQGRFQGSVCTTPLSNVDSGSTLTNPGAFDYHYFNHNTTGNPTTYDEPLIVQPQPAREFRDLQRCDGRRERHRDQQHRGLRKRHDRDQRRDHALRNLLQRRRVEANRTISGAQSLLRSPGWSISAVQSNLKLA